MPYNRPTWDLTSALFAVRTESDYFSLSPRGIIVVDDTGITQFHPDLAGRHQYLLIGDPQRQRTLEAMILLASQPPDRPAQ